MKRKILMICAVMILIMSSLTGCGGTETINLNDYLTVEVTGYDTVGKANVTFDMDSLIADYPSIKVAKTDNAEIAIAQSIGIAPVQIMYDSCVDLSADRDKLYSNGDVLEVVWECDNTLASEVFGCKLTYENVSYTVSNLEKVETFNPFEYIEISYSGYSPRVDVAAAKLDGNEYMENLRVTIKAGDSIANDIKSNMKNGDAYIVEVLPTTNYTDFVNTYGVLPNPTTKEFMVEKQPFYITSGSELTEEITSIIEADGREFYEGEVNKLSDTSFYQGMNYIGYYVVCDLLYEVIPVFEVNVIHPTDGEFTYYMAAEYTNLCVEIDGSLSFSSIDVPQTGFLQNDTFERNGVWYLGFESLDKVKEKYMGSFTIDNKNYETNLE